MRLAPDDDEDQGINLTPMIDVVFLLLIFFLTATTFQKEEVEMNLDLPPAASGQQGSERKVIIVNVTRDGRLLVDGRDVGLEALRQKLKAAAARNKDQEVMIRGDKSTQYGLVVQVLDACQLAKLHAISLRANPAPDDPR